MHSFAQKRSLPCGGWVLAWLLLGAVLWYLLYFYATTSKAPSIQTKISDASNAALDTQASLVNVTSMVDGRDITLSGVVASEEARQQAENIANEIRGSRLVYNNIQVKKDVAQVPSAPAIIFRSTAKVEPMPDSFPALEKEHAEEQVEEQLNAAQQSIDALNLSNISFLLGSATLTENASNTLNEIADLLSRQPDVQVLVAGHTDNTGDPKYNLDLSTRRAQSVVDYLASQGIDNSRLTAKGFGDAEPIASNDTKEGRSENRRIEFKLINGEN